MDHPATPRPTIVLRLSVTLRLPSTAVVRRFFAALPRPRPLPIAPWSPSAVLRQIAMIATKLAIALILLLAFLLVTAAPAYGEAALRSGLWDLPSLVEGPRPDVSSGTLSLVVAAIVVLAVVFSHSGRGHDRW